MESVHFYQGKLILRQKAKAGFNDQTGVHVISWGSKVHW